MSLACTETLDSTPVPAVPRPCCSGTWGLPLTAPDGVDVMAEVEHLLHLEQSPHLQVDPRRLAQNFAAVAGPRKCAHARAETVNTCLYISSALGLDGARTALGVHLLDRFLSRQGVGPECLPRAAAACLLLAAKSRGGDCRVPMAADFAKLLQCRVAVIAALELVVLETVEWRVQAGTAHDFATLALSAPGPLAAATGAPHDHHPLPRSFVHQVEFFLDVSLTEAWLQGVAPSLVGAGAVLAALELRGGEVAEPRRNELLGMVRVLARGRLDAVRACAGCLANEWRGYRDMEMEMRPSSPCTVMCDAEGGEEEITPLGLQGSAVWYGDEEEEDDDVFEDDRPCSDLFCDE